ncbi:MAG: phosphotransferase [Pirellulales bacterium]
MEWWEPILMEYRGQPGLAGPDPPVLRRASGSGFSSVGFSGAGIWRVETPTATYALRRWPPGAPDARRLEFIHRVLAHAQRHGAPPLAGPLPTDRGPTWVQGLDHLWELAPWLPGAADLRLHPSDDRLAVAMRGLAQFHRATRDFAPQTGPSPGLKYRHQLAQRIDAIAAAWHTSPGDWPTAEIRHRIGELILPLLGPAPSDASVWLGGSAPPLNAGQSWRQVLQTACQHSWPLQPCLRDIWHPHVFFQGDRLTGFIDFGAVNWEHRSADIGRLLGSLVARDTRSWELGLSAYQEVWPLEPAELELAQLFHKCNVDLSGLSWAEWIYVERREFPDWSAVAGRLDELQQLARPAPPGATATDSTQLWLPPSPDYR